MKTILDVKTPVDRPVRILQFGEGNFLRAFVDWHIDILNEKTDFNGNVVMVQPLAEGMGAFINQQKGLYTTVLRGIHDGGPVVDYRIVTSVKECLNPYLRAEYRRYLDYAGLDTLRFVISNTTEAGISFRTGDAYTDEPPLSFPAKVTQFLHKRFIAFDGDNGKGLVFIPCELIAANGDNLKRIVLQYAADWKLGDAFIAWVEHACDFCCTLVDRIVPGFPKQEAVGICEDLGYKDDLLDAAEIFQLWVIECHNEKCGYEDELPLNRAGLDVVWTNDQRFYRTRKVRILNGAHTLFVLAGFLYGHDEVGQCMNDPVMLEFISKGLFDEIIPSMDGDADMLRQYARDVLDRFSNPYIKHLLHSISLNSVSKFKTRDLPSILGYEAVFGKAPKILSFSIASLIAFYHGNGIANRQMTGKRDGIDYPICDDESILRFFEDLHARTDDPRMLAHETLARSDFWGQDLSRLPGLEDAVTASLADIQTKGIRQAVTDLVR
jgi:tagaturonate reductase